MKLRYLLALLLLLLPACTDSGAMPMTMLSGSVSSAVGDGWIGCTGDESDWIVPVARQYWSRYTTTTAGNVRYAHLWLVDGQGGDDLCLSLHTEDGVAVLSGAYGTLTDDVEGWIVIDMGDSYALAESTEYLLCLNKTGTPDPVVGRSDDCAIDYIYKDYDDYGCGQAIGEGTAPTGDTEAGDNSLTIVFDNTSDAAPSTP